MEEENKITFQLKIYLPNVLISTQVCALPSMSMDGFCRSLQKMIMNLPQYDLRLQTFDIYGDEKERIALLSDEKEIYYPEAYDMMECVSHLYKRFRKLSVIVLKESIPAVLKQDSLTVLSTCNGTFDDSDDVEGESFNDDKK